MNNKMKLFAATCLSTSLLFSAGFTNVAQAEEINDESQEKAQFTQEDLDYMTSFFNKYNVDNETQRKLIEKIENGILLDCYVVNKQPIKTYTLESENVTETVAVYEDGSIIVNTLDLSEATVEEFPGISPFDLDTSEGSVTSGSGYRVYKNAYVYSSSVVVRVAGFYADFTVVNGGYSYISYIDPAYYLTPLGGYSNNESLTLTTATESSGIPAEAILKFTYVGFNGGGSTTLWLKLRIQNGKFTTPSHL